MTIPTPQHGVLRPFNRLCMRMLQVEEATPAGEVEPPSKAWELGTPPVGEEDEDAAAGGHAAQNAVEEEGSQDATLAEAAAPAEATRGADREAAINEAAASDADEFDAADAKTVALPGGGQWQVTCDEDACEVRGTSPCGSTSGLASPSSYPSLTLLLVQLHADLT